jgi:hypothetical protein
VSKLNGHAPPDPLDELDDVIAELEGSEWDDEEITAEHYIHVEKGGTVIVDQTGKNRAMSKQEADEITLTDHGALPKQQSDPPPSKVSPLSIAWLMAKKFPPWGAVLVAIACIIAFVLTR